jgi:hypothetical protein
VPGLEEFVDDGRTDVSARAGNKNVHGFQVPSDRRPMPSSQRAPGPSVQGLFHMKRCSLGITKAHQGYSKI